MPRETMDFYSDYFNRIWVEWVDSGMVRVPFIHQELRTEWCLSTYKTGLLRILKVRRKLNLMGFPIVYVKIDIDEKMKKFEETFGFTEYHRTDESIFMYQKTEV